MQLGDWTVLGFWLWARRLCYYLKWSGGCNGKYWPKTDKVMLLMGCAGSQVWCSGGYNELVIAAQTKLFWVVYWDASLLLMAWDSRRYRHLKLNWLQKARMNAWQVRWMCRKNTLQGSNTVIFDVCAVSVRIMVIAGFVFCCMGYGAEIVKVLCFVGLCSVLQRWLLVLWVMRIRRWNQCCWEMGTWICYNNLVLKKIRGEMDLSREVAVVVVELEWWCVCYCSELRDGMSCWIWLALVAVAVRVYVMVNDTVWA